MESNLRIVEREHFSESSGHDDVFHYAWAYEDRIGIEDFCASLADDNGEIGVRVYVPQLETGVLEIGLRAVMSKAVAYLLAFDSLELSEPQSRTEFRIVKHTYYYYGIYVKIPKEVKWHLTVRGFWAGVARRHLKAV